MMKDRKRLLLLGGSDEMLPLIRLAQSEGYEVFATDRNPEAPGLQLADRTFCLDAANTDAVMALAHEAEIDAITTRTELLLPTIASVCKAMHLPGPTEKCAKLSVNKYLFRDEMQRAGIRTPRFASPENTSDLENALSWTGFPAIIKPVDFSGSTGVSMVRDNIEGNTAFHQAMKASPTGRVIVEQFISGREISVETWTQFGETHFAAFTDKQVSANGHFVELRHTIPAALSADERAAVMEEVKKMANAMELNDAIAHTEVILTKDGPCIIETGARPGGDHIAFRLVPLATGIDMYRVMFELSVGHEVSLAPPEGRAAAIQYVSSENHLYIDTIHQSVLLNTNFVEYIPGILYNPGKLTCSADRMGAYLFSAETADSLAKSLCIFDGANL